MKSSSCVSKINGVSPEFRREFPVLLASGRSIHEAAVLGAKINRLLGELTKPTPAFSVSDLLPSLPAAMETALSESS